MASREVVDLEAQLRRYADQVEGSVGEVAVDAVPAAERSRRPWVLAGAAVVALLVGVVGLVVAAGDDHDPTPVETDRAGDSAVAGEDNDELEPDRNPDLVEGSLGIDGWLPADSLLDAGPLSPRTSAAVVPIGDQVIVWGGSVESFNFGRPDLANTQLADGAVYATVSGTWTEMAESPLPANGFAPAAAVVGDRVLIARGDATAFYHPARDVWSVPSTTSIRFDEFAITDAGEIFGWGDQGAAAFNRLASTWTVIDDTDAARGFTTFSDYVWTGDELWAVRWGLTERLRAGAAASFFVDRWDATSSSWSTFATTSLDGAMFFDVAWSDADDAAVIAAENGAVVRISSDGTATDVPRLQGGGFEGGPAIVRGHGAGLAVAWAPNVHRLMDGTWQTAPLPDGFGGPLLGRSTASDPLWVFGIRSGETDGGNYFATIGVEELFATENVPAGTCDECVPLPDFVGMSESDATRAAQSVLGVEFAMVPIGDPTNGTVISQSPPAGTMVGPGRIVFLTVGESGEPAAEIRPASVPSVVGLLADTAMATLRNKGLLPIVEFRVVPSGDPQIGVVLEQTPVAFDEVPGGSEVTIIVGEAAGPDFTVGQVVVPDLTGLTLTGALEIVVELGLRVTEPELRVVPPGGPPFGRVMAQSPAAGSLVEVGTFLRLTIAQPE